MNTSGQSYMLTLGPLKPLPIASLGPARPGLLLAPHTCPRAFALAIAPD